MLLKNTKKKTFFFCYDQTESHALANKRLSKQITKATKSLKTSVDEYNKLECSTTCSLPHTLAFDSVKDPDSDVWLEVNATGESTPAVPVTVKRKAVDLYSLLDRCREEITLLQSEMCNTVDHFTRQHQLLKTSMNDSLENLSPESKGRDIFIRRKLLSLESYLVYLKVLFDDHIENVSLPTLLFEDNLPALQRQEDEISTELVSSREDLPYLLSLPECETVSLDEGESDTEDDDDLCEDQDSAFFSLQL